ncbi:MAG: hypothetical protein DMF59_14675 [Acidobacteria bacterium]|nr:MAG: hypothetical protein DMF59_14675 [Acidobacteriota bacterium]
MLVGERRDIVPIGTELRSLAWLGVMLIATGVGIVITKHFDQIGPLTIAMAVALAAIACYAFAVWKQSSVRDYMVLLGALLISADVGFIESQWHLLGSEWQRHFLLLAVLHAAAAYYFGNRAVLSLSVAALASWFGIEKHEIFSSNADFAFRAFICAAVLLTWRVANRKADFNGLFEHSATNIAFWGALSLTFDPSTKYTGFLVTAIFAAGSLTYGLKSRRELFLMYAGVYGLIAIDFVVVDWIHEPILASFYLLISTIAAIAALFATHVRFQKERLADA